MIKALLKTREGLEINYFKNCRYLCKMSYAEIVKISEYVTKKITSGAARIKLGMQDKLFLGNLDARRDWGDAREYVKVMHTMLQQDKPDDYVIGTGKTHAVRDFVELAFSELGLDYKEHVEIDQRFFRPSEKELLVADPSKARKELKWDYNASFEDLVKDMVRSDYEYFKKDGK